MQRTLDATSLLTIILTCLLFAAALFVRGWAHDLLLEAGVLLVSARLIPAGHRSTVTAPLLSFALAFAITGCGDVAITITTDTGLIGIVLRGPVQPVCQVQVPCDAPFGASFTAQQGDRVVATFRSDAQGRFQVHLAPGAYLIVPGPDAPIISPSGQAKAIVVGPDGLTSVRLEFDTGIR